MIIFLKKWHVICLLFTLFTLVPLTLANAAALTDEVTDVPIDKTWKVKFNLPIIESSITSSSVYIMNSKLEKQNVKVIASDNIVTIHAPETSYEPGETYTLHITKNVLGKNGEKSTPLKKEIVKPFIITKGYTVVTVQEDGTYLPVKNYKTFHEANASLKQNQGIMRNKKYVKIPAGFAATNTQAVTITYKQAIFTAQYQYAGVSADTELVYVDATENYVKVKAFGQDMYVKHENVTLIPAAAAKGQSHYIANEQGLWHSIYHHNSGKYDAAYLAGKKPEFLTKGGKYYSTDGINFVDANGKAAGESYSYFQYVSLRVPTSHSAAELDAYIDSELAAKEKTGYTKYANATIKSPLKGLGATLKTIENKHRINALFLLSFAIHESDYGMSCHAQNNNNLFGLNIPDSNDQCSINGNISSEKYFASIENNITALINRLNTNYLNPLNMADYRYNGVALGNKMIGMNVRYASDPYWGAKIAGHMHRADKALGSKDHQKYAVGFTAVSGVSIRKEPAIQNGDPNNRAYQYKLDGTIKRLDKMPITLSNTSSGSAGWLHVISELPQDGTDLYTVRENVLIVPTH